MSTQTAILTHSSTRTDVRFVLFLELCRCVSELSAGQLGARGWTEEGVRDLTKKDPSRTSVDNTGDRNDPATVYGTRDGGHVVVNDKTGNVTQVSDKKDPEWKPDSRIRWKDDP